MSKSTSNSDFIADANLPLSMTVEDHWLCETFVVDRDRTGYQYSILGNRYTPMHNHDIPPSSSTAIKSKARAVSLVFLHAGGMVKESFEPVIKLLFKEHRESEMRSGVRVIVKEAWSIECPNHGCSAAFNTFTMRKRPALSWSFLDYAEAAHVFLTNKPGGHDLSTRNLVLIGQSLGAHIIPFIAQMSPKLSIHSIVLAEPSLSLPCHERNMAMKVFSETSLCKHNIWESRDAVRRHFETYRISKHWSRDARETFLENGIVEDPVLCSFGFKGVRLACSREQEASMYVSVAEDDEGYDLLAGLYASDIPVHYLYDPNPPSLLAFFLPAWFSCKGLRPDTVNPVQGGHMFFQSNPQHTAKAIGKTLRHERSSSAVAAKTVARM
ncbi:hypothetical protein SISNIDRAFT_551314 [Sistotremastrum niveocremeum HHB9708]|uniref:AB hydrolase-1 domain-containing protein n=1 Tax=Sistotremastrum niveocremeum HHB9708 TaxID=1314777 RepID=A0A164RWQ0_9AGAM|nr:hypothetical protein SISNIDRAFT_551314 [Sistotremastrum niveocremeum HHB9708]